MKARRNSHALVASAGVSAALLAASLVPGAQAAAPFHRCANRPERLEIETGVAGQAPEIFKTTIKAISTQGVSCGAADKFLDLLEKDKTSTPPEHYKCAIGKFKAPVGLVPESCTHKGAVIRFAEQGG